MNKQAINLTSLHVIQQELMATIDKASTHLETFIRDRKNLKVLDDCIDSLQQIRGSLELIQLYGACELAAEILATANDIKMGNVRDIEDRLAVLTKGFFVLNCYYEYTRQHETGMPVLLVPYINDIRLANRQTLIPESFFETTTTTYRCPMVEREVLSQEQQLSIRRYRHMYQVGLLGVIKEVNTQASLGMMRRAVGKIYVLSKGSKSETLWWLSRHTLQAFISADMPVNISRKHLFSTLDKALRYLEKGGETAFEQEPEEQLLKELAYFISIAGINESEYLNITQFFGFSDIGYTDKSLQEEVTTLTGPNANTVQSVAEVLRVELNTCKEQIEKAQMLEGSALNDTYEDTLTRLHKVKEILSIVGLISASEILVGSIQEIERSQSHKEPLNEKVVTVIADAFLYIESVLSSLEKRNFSGEKLAELNRLTQAEIMSTSHLEDAQLVVIHQIKEGLQTIKVELTAFTDSNYDKTHIERLADLLSEIRGGMLVLDQPRAGNILEKCIAFIEQTLMSDNEIAAIEQLLEIFADALICLEYYVDCMKFDQNVSGDILTVAEDSLSALGFSVTS